MKTYQTPYYVIQSDLDRDAVLARPGLEGVTAIREGRVHEVPAELILQPGPACLTDGLDYVERVLGSD